nr:iron-sulfur cluster biosynthesis family protein [Liquorilactobacillus satsumensis]
MFLTVTPAAKKKLKKYLSQNNLHFLLSFDDGGVGLYSKVQATCSLEINFELIVVNRTADLTDFDTTLETNVGPFLIKGYSKEFLDEKSRLDVDKFGALLLAGNYTGIIASNVTFIDLSAEKQRPLTKMEKMDEIAN